MVVHVSHVNANQVVDALLKPLPRQKKKKQKSYVSEYNH